MSQRVRRIQQSTNKRRALRRIYCPSRGAVNRTGDSWIQLDASLKQYQCTQGMDLKSAVPLDAQALIDQSKSGATINDTEGWVQNLNAVNLQTALTIPQFGAFQKSETHAVRAMTKHA
jgi:hypothetical protein